MFFALQEYAEHAGTGSAAYRDRLRLVSLQEIDNGRRHAYSVSDYTSHVNSNGVSGQHIQGKFFNSTIY